MIYKHLTHLVFYFFNPDVCSCALVKDLKQSNIVHDPRVECETVLNE